MKNNMEAPQQTKNITIKQSSNSILGIYQKKTETLIPKGIHQISITKWKTRISYNPAIQLLGIHPKKTKTLIQKDICTLVLIAALCSQGMEATCIYQ